MNVENLRYFTKRIVSRDWQKASKSTTSGCLLPYKQKQGIKTLYMSCFPVSRLQGRISPKTDEAAHDPYKFACNRAISTTIVHGSE